MKEPIIPTITEINETVSKIKRRIKPDRIRNGKNDNVLEGYEAAIKILENGLFDPYDDIKKLKSDQARAIALLAVDYLNGELDAKILVNIPIRK